MESRQRRPQFMRDVSQQTLLAQKKPLDTLCHAVKRLGQGPDFVIAAHRKSNRQIAFPKATDAGGNLSDRRDHEYGSKPAKQNAGASHEQIEAVERWCLWSQRRHDHKPMPSVAGSMGNDVLSVFLSTEVGERGVGKKDRKARPRYYVVPIRIEQIVHAAKYGIQTMHVGRNRSRPSSLQHLCRFLH